MKLLKLSWKLWRANARAQKGTWALLLICLLLCYTLFCYVFISPFLDAEKSIYSNLTNRHTEIKLSGGGINQEELGDVFALLENSSAVDYYILESRLNETVADAFTSVSTVVPTRISLYALQPSEHLCNSEYGEPLDGYVYGNTKYTFEDRTTASVGDTITADGQSYRYHINFWGDDMFDLLISNHDFMAYQKPIRRIIYGINPYASRGAVNRLNAQLAKLLPNGRFDVVMDRRLGVKLRNSMSNSISYFVLPCLMTYFLLVRYQIDRRLRELTVARLVGGSRKKLTLSLTCETLLNALAANLLVMLVFTIYQLLFGTVHPRALPLLWLDIAPVMLGLTVFSGLLGLTAALLRMRRAPILSEKELAL